ncbi:hypothetical protein GOV07_02310 [Candidatus Woesearchaeota archaeon]|nr:hypothetical protein [Candidatus Woesearchaeota archaeon]
MTQNPMFDKELLSAFTSIVQKSGEESAAVLDNAQRQPKEVIDFYIDGSRVATALETANPDLYGGGIAYGFVTALAHAGVDVSSLYRDMGGDENGSLKLPDGYRLTQAVISRQFGTLDLDFIPTESDLEDLVAVAPELFGDVDGLPYLVNRVPQARIGNEHISLTAGNMPNRGKRILFHIEDMANDSVATAAALENYLKGKHGDENPGTTMHDHYRD